MRKGVIGAVALGAIAAVAGVANGQTARRFTVCDVPTRITHHHTVTVGKLVRPGTNVVVGHDKAKFSFNGDNGPVRVRAVFFFPQGKIKAAGQLQNNRFQILGGTRAFNGIAGKVRVHRSHGQRTPLTFTIVR